MSDSLDKKIKRDIVHKKRTSQTYVLFMYVLKTITILMTLLIVFFIVENFIINNNSLKKNIYIQDKLVSGMYKDDFVNYIESYNNHLIKQKIFLKINKTEIIVLPSHIGLSLNAENLWNKVYTIGREKNIIKNFSFWIESFFVKIDINLESLADTYTFEDYLKTWESDAGLKKPFEGSIEIKNQKVHSQLPHSGEKIDEETLLKTLVSTFIQQKSDSRIIAPIISDPYTRNPESIVESSKKLENVIGQAVILANTEFEDVSLTLSRQDLIDMVTISVPLDPLIAPEIYIDDLTFAHKLLVLQVRDAEFKVNKDYTVDILSSRNGIDVDTKKTKENFMQVIFKPERSIVRIEVNEIVPPSFSDSDANNLGITHVVSEFTTHYPCCVDRALNIQLIADLIDGTIIYPGETFNVNNFIGERTEDKGFKAAGSIFKGEMVDSVGGGISQFITTLHNSLYWGGYEIVKHKAHSIYFSRYPHGIDATINWPYLDYIFRNDTDSAIIIDTEHTDTSITIRILGNNDGRVVTGDHIYWNTPMKIINEGGKNARRVVSDVKDAFAFRSPVVRYQSDAKLARGTKILVKTGKNGWQTSVNRQIYLGQELYRQDIWPVYYESGKETIYRIHPCDNPTEKNKSNC